MSIKSSAAAVGNAALGIVFLLALLALPAVFIVGAAALGEIVLPWLMLLSVFAFGVSVFVLLPLALIPPTRGAGAIGLLIASYVFGLTDWFLGLLLTWALWGTIAVVIGLVVLGVGVVPIAILATLFNGMWIELGVLVVLVLCTYGSRVLALYFAERADERAEYA